MTAAPTSRMLTGMATNVVTRTSAAASCCKKCGTGGALLVNDGVALCPTCWYEKYRPNSTASATAP